MHEDEIERLRLAVLISGSGRTLEYLLAACQSGLLPGEIVGVISSRPGVRGLSIAQQSQLRNETIQRSDFDTDLHFSEALYGAVEPWRPHLLILAGFLRRIAVSDRWQGRILNIHPALLPESGLAGAGFYGDRVHEAVLASGASESGATVHVVDDLYDHGPVVMTSRVPVLPGDTPQLLAARVFAAEQGLYPAAIRQYVASHPEVWQAKST